MKEIETTATLNLFRFGNLNTWNGFMNQHPAIANQILALRSIPNGHFFLTQETYSNAPSWQAEVPSFFLSIFLKLLRPSFLVSDTYTGPSPPHYLITATFQAGTPGSPPHNALYTQNTSHQLKSFRGFSRTRSNSYWVFLIWLQFWTPHFPRHSPSITLR